MAEHLKDKVAVVTGAGRGIGRAIALAFAAEGAKVVVNNLSQSAAEQVVEEIRGSGGTAVPNLDSVALMDGAQRIVQTAVDRFGGLDILVNNAGIVRNNMIYNMNEEEWDSVIAVHLKGTFACSKYASLIMKKQQSGRIINFCSEAGLMGNAGQASYGSAKGGISGLTKATARDMGKYGVTFNCIVPRAWTPATASITAVSTPTRVRALSQSPFDELEGKTFAELGYAPEDVAPMAVYLASDAAASVNGQFFLVYGDEISLLTQPRPIRTISKKGRWTVDELSLVMPKTLTKGIANPAPSLQPAT